MEKFSDELQEEQEIIDSIYNFESRDAKWSVSNDVVSLKLRVSLQDGTVSETFEIALEFGKDYPEKSPEIKEIRNVIHVEDLDENDYGSVFAELKEEMKEWEGECVVLNCVNFVKEKFLSLLEEKKKDNEEKYLEEKEKKVKSAKKKLKENKNKNNLFYVSKDDFFTPSPSKDVSDSIFEGKKYKEYVDHELCVSISNKLKHYPIYFGKEDSENCFGAIDKIFDKFRFQTMYTNIQGSLKKKFRNNSSEFEYIFKLMNYPKKTSKKSSSFTFKEIKDFTELSALFDYASCSFGEYFFIHGGYRSRSKTNDLFRINLSKRIVERFINLEELDDRAHVPENYNYYGYNRKKQNSFLTIPAMSGHKMINWRGGLFIFGSEDRLRRAHFLKTNEYHHKKEMMFYFISKPASECIHYGYFFDTKGQSPIRIRHPVRKDFIALRQSFIPVMKHFSVCLVENIAWVFGGIKNETVFDLLYSVEWLSDNKLRTKLFKNSKSEDVKWPKERYGHDSIGYKQYSFLIFGGKDKNDNYLNDLWSFNVSSNIWTEIEINYYPPVQFFCSYKVNNGFVLFGGMTKDKINETIYSFDENDKKFYLIKFFKNMLIEEEEKKEIEDSNDDDDDERRKKEREFDEGIFKSNCTVSISSGKVLIVGGRNKEKNIKEVVVLENALDGGKFEILSYLEKSRNNNIMTDVTFRIQEENEEITEIHAHKCIISVRCKNLMMHIKKSESEKEENTIVNLGKEFDGYAFNAYIKFLYTGEIKLQKKVNEFIELVKDLSYEKHYKTIEKICLKKKQDSDLSIDVFEEILKDFNILFQKSIRSDCRLIFADDSELKLHKLFLCRSKYFVRMLQSNFIEAQTGDISFQQFNKDAIYVIINYLYTNDILLSSSNAIAVMIYSLQFELKEVSNYCHRYVQKFLSVENVNQIAKMAEIYTDNVLISICVRFIVNNYEQVSLREDYDQLSTKIRGDIVIKYERLKKKQKKKKSKINENLFV